ncbi:unnamed protein product [Closterium sp. NIES-53]
MHDTSVREGVCRWLRRNLPPTGYDVPLCLWLGTELGNYRAGWKAETWRILAAFRSGGILICATRRIRVRAGGIESDRRAPKWGENMKNCQIILGSSSQSRQQVLREIGVPFEIMVGALITQMVRNEDV